MRLSRDGAEQDSHFDLHREWLSLLRSELGSNLPRTLGELAFFTEMAFCPTQGTPDEEVLFRCYRLNSRGLLHAANFKIVVAVGRIPTQMVLSEAGVLVPSTITAESGRTFWAIEQLSPAISRGL